MLKKIKHHVGYHFLNIRGWKTNRKIIVIESDDWGTIRMPNASVRNELFINQIDSYNSGSYDKFDTIADNDDLKALFKILLNYRDKNGNPPVITANTIVANPDFQKIKNSGYKKYYFEKFTKTLEKYYKGQNTFDTWKEGIKSSVFKPQFHGREHLNVKLWLTALQNDEKGVREAFEHETWPARLVTGERLDIAYNYVDEEQLKFIINSIDEGASIFEEIFGYKSVSFIAPSYTWCTSIEKKLKQIGVKYIQGGLYQKYPHKVITEKKQSKARHYTGEKNHYNQTYLMRNVHFEPALTNEKDIVSRCLSDIDIAFKWNKPAIISSHRLNYIGAIENENRMNTLNKLDELLAAIIKKYPNIEFMSSDQLGDLMSRK